MPSLSFFWFLSLLLCIRIQRIHAFSPVHVSVHQTLRSCATAFRPSRHPTELLVVADAEEKEKKNKNTSDDTSASQTPAWTETANGGFIPNLASRNPTVAQVTTIDEYKRVVVDEQDLLVCVRFYAPWCKACRAVQARFRKLAKEYPTVKFVECPLTKSNAFLHEGLGVPSLPYGHIYHPSAGLVEERRIGRHVFDEFQQVLQTHVQGYCDIDWSTSGAMGKSTDDEQTDVDEPLQ